MSTLWLAGDTIKEKRINRVSILGRLLFPMFDEDQSAVTTVDAKRLAGVLLTGAVTTLYTAPGSGVAHVHGLTLRNTHSAALAVELYLVPNAGSAGVAERIFDDTLEAGETAILAPTGGWFLGASGTIRGKAGTTNLVALRAEVTEYAAQPGGLTLKVIDGVALGTSYSTLYTANAGSLKHALLLNYTLCNTDTVDRAPNITIVESGDTSSAEDEIFGDTLVSKETLLDDTPRLLAVNDFVQGKASQASVVSARLTVLEVVT